MSTYPTFPCSVCDRAVQESLSSAKKAYLEFLRGGPLFSELDSNHCIDTCTLFSRRTSARHTFLAGLDHFNFAGIHSGVCCYCALGQGWYVDSFIAVGCYSCKHRDSMVKEFSKLKIRIAGSSPSWRANGLGGLPDFLIDYILKIAIGEKAKLVST
jgi:hypothetical protein